MTRLLTLVFLLTSFTLSAQKRPSLIPYRKGDKWGYCDTTKKIVIAPQYSRAFPFVKGKALVISQRGSLLQIDSTGHTIAPMPYDAQDYVGYGMLRVGNAKHKTGLLGMDGVLVLPVRYDAINVLNSDSFEVILPGRKDVINRKGKVFSKTSIRKEETEGMDAAPMVMPAGDCDKPCRWGPFSEGMAVAAHKGKFGYTNEAMKLAVPCKYALADQFLYGVGRVTFDKPGQKSEPPFTDASGVVHATAITMEDGYVDRLGTEYWEEE